MTRSATMFRRTIGISAGLAMLLTLPFLATGCGSNRDANVADDESEHAAAEEPAAETAAKPATRATKKKAENAHIGEIPKDLWPELWFKDPLAVVAESGAAQPARTPVQPEAPAVAQNTAPMPPAESASKSAGNAAPPGGAGDWGRLISGEELGNEVKAVKSSLSDKLQSVGKYSGNYKEVRVEAAVLAALAGIVKLHPDGPSWKTNAKFVRDLSSEIVREAKANGQKFYDPTRAAFDKLESVLSGNLPPDLAEAAETVPFSEVASRREIMSRLERVRAYVKQGVTTEAQFNKELDKVAHEAAVLRAMVRVVATEGYDLSDDDLYKEYTNELIDAGQKITDAVQNKDFNAFNEAVNRIEKACSACHQEYKNS